MENIIKFLKGKKTFFVAGAIFILGGIRSLGYIDESAYSVLVGLLGALGLASLRAGVDEAKTK